MLECEDNNLCVNFIEKWLLSRLSISSNDTIYRIERINAAIEQLCVAPQTFVTKLSSNCCLSKKQFEREFYLHVGMNHKEYSRIVRLQKALALLQQKRNYINHAQIAYASGYADQSYYIREFKRLSGYTPHSLFKITEPYSDLFTIPV